MILTNLSKYSDFGLLFLRVGLGVAFMAHGLPKLSGGAETWEKLGSNVGLPMPVVFGFLAALSEFVGGLMLIAGAYFRVAVILLIGTMAGALLFHLKAGDGFLKYSHALESLIVFIGLLFVGPGKYSVDRK
jgi:putative oxidoreductase